MKQSLSAMDNIKILGIPFDFGQDHIGVRLAYEYLKSIGLKTILSSIVPIQEMISLSLPLKKEEELCHSKIKHKKLCSYANHLISEQIQSMDLSSSFLLNIGGDHGAALGTIHGILKHRPETIVIWADAHGDINTPATSSTGNFHGMPLAFLLNEAQDEDFLWMKRKLLPRNLIFFGPRDLDPGEKAIIKRLGIFYFSSDEINSRGTKEILDSALKVVDPLGEKPIHLSFDIDICDANDMPSTGTRVSIGPTLHEVFNLGKFLAKTKRLRSMDIVELNPLIGNESEVKESCHVIFKFLFQTLHQVFSIDEHITDSVYF